MNKKHNNALLKVLLRQHIAHIALVALVTVCMASITMVGTNKIVGVEADIARVQEEILKLQEKRALLSSVSAQNLTTLESDLELMNRLIPESENYFTIIQTLERLSAKTGFQVTSYTINLKGSTENKLALSVHGEGEHDAFMRFLQSYQGDGGRFITIEEIALDPQQPNQIQLSLNFYSKSSDEPVENTNYQATIDELNKLKSKIDYQLLPGEQDQLISAPVSTKSNPF